jgi:hypothetical protein
VGGSQRVISFKKETTMKRLIIVNFMGMRGIPASEYFIVDSEEEIYSDAMEETIKDSMIVDNIDPTDLIDYYEIPASVFNVINKE